MMYMKIGVRASNALIPVVVCLGLVYALLHPPEGGWLLLVGVALLAAVVVAVHHAEVIALRVGEPFGTLVLALAVTAIESALLVSLMLSGGETAISLARDTVFATVMIICNGVVGLCLLLGALRYRVQAFRVEGTSPALSVLAALTTLTLVLPSFTSSTPGPTLAPSQLIFAGIVSLALYGVFVFVQTVRHREYFLPPKTSIDEPVHVLTSTRSALISLVLLVMSLVAVVGLAKTLSPHIEQVVKAVGVPQAALRNRLQTSFNLALFTWPFLQCMYSWPSCPDVAKPSSAA
jgi:Ca2+:H+ antiporter